MRIKELTVHLLKTELPSNRKFGLFFACIFFIVSVYFFFEGNLTVAWIFVTLMLLFGLLALSNSEALSPLNILWMRLGILLGSIVSPIVLGAIFFFVFTPIGLFMRLIGHDELGLRMASASSYWKHREPNEPSTDSFDRQF